MAGIGDAFETFTGRYTAIPSERIIKNTVFIPTSGMLSLASTPVLVAPAAGPGTVILLHQAVIRYNFGGIPFTNGGGALVFFHQPGNDLVTPICSTDITVSRSTVESYRDADVYNTSLYDNNSLYIQMTGTGPTLGNGSMNVTVFYTIETAH